MTKLCGRKEVGVVHAWVLSDPRGDYIVVLESPAVARRLGFEHPSVARGATPLAAGYRAAAQLQRRGWRGALRLHPG